MRPAIDTKRPHSARVYDYYLGGKDRHPVGVGGLERTCRQAGIPAQARTAAEFAALAFRGLAMIEPGVVLVSHWRRPAGPPPPANEVNWYGGIGRKTGYQPSG